MVSMSTCGKKGWVARSSTSSSPENNLLLLFPQTYVFTDEEDDALKRRMGNDLSCNTTSLHFQPLRWAQHENCLVLVLPSEAHPSPCHVGGPQAPAAMVWFSWCTPGHAADCLKASMGGNSP